MHSEHKDSTAPVIHPDSVQSAIAEPLPLRGSNPVFEFGSNGVILRQINEVCIYL